MLMSIYRDASKLLSCHIIRIIYCHSPGRLWSRFESFQFNRKQHQQKTFFVFHDSEPQSAFDIPLTFLNPDGVFSN